VFVCELWLFGCVVVVFWVVLLFGFFFLFRVFESGLTGFFFKFLVCFLVRFGAWGG